MSKIILQETPTNQSGFPRQDFNKPDFESLIFQKGYDVWHEPAILCPCKLEGSDNRTNCQNCGGSGYVFLNKTQTRMILTGMNVETKYKEWSEERIGQVKISCSDKNPLGFMDKITLINSDSLYSQILFPKVYNGKYINYLNYESKVVLDCYMFVGVDRKLKRLSSPSDYVTDGAMFFLDSKYLSVKEQITVSIRYRHSVVYHVLDMTRDIMTTNILDEITGREIPTSMPLSGVGRRAHYMIDYSKYGTDRLFDNTYTVDKTC